MKRLLGVSLLLLLLVAPATPATAAPDFETWDNLRLEDTKAFVENDRILVRGDLWVGGFGMYSVAGHNQDSAIPGAIAHYWLDYVPDFGIVISLGLVSTGGQMSYSLPVKVDGRDEGRWLAVGSIGTGVPPSTAYRGWAGICTSVIAPCAPVQGGFGSYFESAYWAAPLQALGAGPGSTLELGSANGGVISQFVWPAAPTDDGIGALSVVEGVPGVKLPGEIRLGIAPAGTPAEDVSYPVRATLEPFSYVGRAQWSGDLPRPALPGPYEVHARMCWGLLSGLDCDHQVVAATI